MMATSAIRRARKKYGSHNSALNLILPYNIANLDLIENQFDSVIIPDELSRLHPKKAIIARNGWMIERSDLLICYVTNNRGGAYISLKYAICNNLKINNIFKD